MKGDNLLLPQSFKLPQSLKEFAPLPSALLKYLSNEAEEEIWGTNHCILRNLLAKHYSQLVTTNEMYVLRDGSVLMNTSLLSRKTQQPLLLLFQPSSKDQQFEDDDSYDSSDGSQFGSNDLRSKKICPYGPPKVIKEGDREAQGACPNVAHFFAKPDVLLLDPNLQFTANLDHIVIDNGIRWPVEVQAMDVNARLALLGRAIANARKRLVRNYKTAVPQVYDAGGRHAQSIQLLLPLSLLSRGEGFKADMALVVERLEHGYRASTVLTLDMAYSNARVLAKPESYWLVVDAAPQRVLSANEGNGGNNNNAAGNNLANRHADAQHRHKYSARVCKFYPLGTCNKGDHCKFSHHKN